MRREYFWTLEEAQKEGRSYAKGIVGLFYHPKDGYVDIPYRWQNPKRLGDFKISLARRAGAYMYKDSKGKKTYVSGKIREAELVEIVYNEVIEIDTITKSWWHPDQMPKTPKTHN